MSVNSSEFAASTTLGDIKDALVQFFNSTWPSLAETITFGIGDGTSALDPLVFHGSVNGNYGDCGWHGGWTCASFNLNSLHGLKNITCLADQVNDPYISQCNGATLLLGSVGGFLDSLNIDTNVHAQVLGLGGDFSVGSALIECMLPFLGACRV